MYVVPHNATVQWYDAYALLLFMAPGTLIHIVILTLIRMAKSKCIRGHRTGSSHAGVE